MLRYWNIYWSNFLTNFWTSYKEHYHRVQPKKVAQHTCGKLNILKSCMVFLLFLPELNVNHIYYVHIFIFILAILTIYRVVRTILYINCIIYDLKVSQWQNSKSSQATNHVSSGQKPNISEGFSISSKRESCKANYCIMFICKVDAPSSTTIGQWGMAAEPISKPFVQSCCT
jgi:hypothetical protein